MRRRMEYWCHINVSHSLVTFISWLSWAMHNGKRFPDYLCRTQSFSFFVCLKINIEIIRGTELAACRNIRVRDNVNVFFALFHALYCTLVLQNHSFYVFVIQSVLGRKRVNELPPIVPPLIYTYRGCITRLICISVAGLAGNEHEWKLDSCSCA